MGESIDEREFNEAWVTPDEALGIVPGAIKTAGGDRQWIMDRLKEGLIRAVARTGPRSAFAEVSANEWRLWDVDGNNHFWVSGDAIFASYESSGYNAVQTTRRYFDVRFDPTSFNGKRNVADAQGQTAVAPIPNRGGRPPKPFWDDMWAAIAAQLYDGDLKPTKQADIESAIHDWLVGNSHDAGTTQVRDRARKLWNLLKD